MRFLTDENFPLPSVTVLRLAGHDVLSVSESLVGGSDRIVLVRARDEHRVLVTFDRDFGELVFRHRLPPPSGIVFLRFQPATPAEAGDLLQAVVHSGTLGLAGRFTVLDRDRVRQRPLPSHGAV